MRISTIIALILYTIAAWYEVGYFHPDEHYQLIEFAGLKTGFNFPEHLAWEYHVAIRPALQPYICVGIFRLLTLVHVTDPYICAFALRWITAVIAILIIGRFVRVADTPYRPALLLLSFFLWFMPYLNTRFSSEIWSGLAMLLAVALVTGERKHYFWCGVLLGFAFECRFQIAFMCVGLAAWLFFVRRTGMKELLWMMGGFLGMIVVGLLADLLFYGFPVLTFIRYFQINIIQGVAAQFGTAPWYTYILYMLNDTQTLIGICLLSALLTVSIMRPRDMIIWIILPFLMAHLFIGHKEGRFLFPLVYYAPYLLVKAYELLKHYLKNYAFYAVIMVCILMNLAGLVVITFKPAGNGRKAISYYIHQHFARTCFSLAYTPLSNPYNTWPGLNENFYQEQCMQTVPIISDSVELAVCSKSEQIDKAGWVLLKQGIPEWIQWMQQFYKGSETEESLMLYRKTNNQDCLKRQP
jgi:GPI mannosyltransferase 3